MTLDPARVFATLERHDVDYLTIGAFAVIAHGNVRATADIDVVACQDRDNLERLSAAFAELHARLRGGDETATPRTRTLWRAAPGSRSTPTLGRSTSTISLVPPTTHPYVAGPLKPPPRVSPSGSSASPTSSG